MGKNQKELAKDGLENLPPKEREETQKMLSDIEAEEKEKSGSDAAKADEEAKAKADADAKAKADADAAAAKAKADAEGGKDDHPARKKSKLVPEYVVKTVESKAKKREEELLAEIENLKKGNPLKDEKKPDEKAILTPAEVTAEVEKELDLISQETGIGKDALKKLVNLPAKVTEKMIADALANVRTETADKLKPFNQLQEENEIKREELEFESDFNKIVVPLIKSEYGDGVSPETLEEIKEKMKAKAYEPANAETPYQVIYKGFDEFRGLASPKTKTGEDSRPGAERGGEAELDLNNLSDEDVANMGREEFEKLSNQLGAKK